MKAWYYRGMPVWISYLLRLVLIATLLGNSVTGAYAAAAMSLGHQAGTSALPRQTAAHDEHDACHDEMREGTPLAADEAPSGSPHGKHEHDGDCCKGSTCRCVCLQSTASVFGSTLSSPGPVREHGPRWRATQHATPVLPHLTRPPIG